MNDNEIGQLMSDENAHLEKLHKIVKETLKAEELIIRNLVNPPVETLTQGQKLSDRVAQFGGSWRFIIQFGIILTGSFSMSWPSAFTSLTHIHSF